MKLKSLPVKLAIILIISVFVLITILFGCRAVNSVTGGAFDEAREVLTEESAAPVMEAPAEAAEAEKAVASEESAAEEPMADSSVQYSDTQLPAERKVIKTAYMEIEVETGNLENTLFKLTSLAEQNGGFVSNSSSNSDEEGRITSGNIEIRVPNDKYNSVIDKIKQYGTLKSISISGQDVTQEYIDLESRLRNMEAQEKVLLDLMKQSKNVADSIEVQRELSNVQGEIEVIKGRMNYLDNMVSFSTISIYLYEPQPISTATGWGFLDALKRGLRGAVSVFNGLMIFLLAASPLLVVAAIIWIIIWQIVKGKRRRRAARVAEKK